MENLIYFFISFSIMGLFFAGLGFLYLFLLRKNKKWIFVITAGFVYCAAVLIAFYAFAKNTAGQDIIQYSSDQMQKSLDKSLDDLKQKGLSPQEVQSAKWQAETFIIRPYAAWVVISVAFVVFLVYFVVRLYALNKYGVQDGMPPFEMWHAGEWVMWCLLAIMFTLIFKGMIKNVLAQNLAYNGAFLLANVYFVAGLAVTSFLFVKFKVPGLARIMFYVMLVIWPYLSAIMILTGVLDTWFNFRRIDKGGAIWK
jgi:uncharacterized protein YybS (DUF2232 family)